MSCCTGRRAAVWWSSSSVPGRRSSCRASSGTALQGILACPTLRALCDETARIFRELTGYDRVMVYRFDEDGHGEVFAERHRPDLEAFLGNRYPASDIPQIARRLYETNRIRVLADVEYVPVPLRPRLLPSTGRDLDMSLCFLRSMSPIHIQYLKNMGVGATLVASLMVGGRLWGLISCHHYAPRFLHYEMRAVSELLAETVATRIAALESFAQAQAELTVRRLEQRLIQAISRDGDWRTALFDRSEPLLHALGASGAALLFEGQVQTAGEVPSTPQLREIGEWLDSRERDPVIATSALATRGPRLRPAHRTGQRAPRDTDLQLSWRVPGLVSPGAGADSDLGRQPVQARRLRQRPLRTVAAPLVRAVASGGRGHLRSMDARRHRGRPADRRDGHRRRAPVSRGAAADHAEPARAGEPPGAPRRAAGDRRRSGGPHPAGEPGLRAAGAREPSRDCAGSRICPTCSPTRRASVRC